MAEEEETYCRLCAEPTLKKRLISIHEEVGIESKIATKLQWINVHISENNSLPTAICFACFDSLERTWIFLNEVRNAQIKLNEIYNKNSDSSENCDASMKHVGKPIDQDWEVFEKGNQEVKLESETENLAKLSESLPVGAIIGEHLSDVVSVIKNETYSDNEGDDLSNRSSDSDIPLLKAVKKKKLTKKKKIDKDLCEDVTWETHMCRCAKCDAQCKNIASLRLHSLEIHARCCTFKCSYCGKVAANYKLFVSHSRRHKNALRNFCEYCDEFFSSSADVKQHKKLSHHNIHLTSCKTCGAMFDTQTLLQDHLYTYSKVFKRRFMKQEVVDFKCKHCGKEFKTRCNLRQHMLLHTNRIRDFSCHICGKMFYTKGTLTTHISTHEDKKPFKCEICLMTFRAKGNLISHISLHSDLKPFVCEQCGKAFRVKRHLKSHSITHTDLRPYICEYCQKSFRFKTRLNLHLRQHTGARPYKCVYCQREFTNGSNYKKHMKRRHNIDTSKKKRNNIDSNVEESTLVNLL